MSKYEEQCDDNIRICPYCKADYQTRSEDYDEQYCVELCRWQMRTRKVVPA